MEPTLITCIIAMVVFSLTVACIAQVVLIDLKYAKDKYGKAKVANLIIWMVIAGVVLNVPFVIMAVNSLGLS